MSYWNRLAEVQARANGHRVTASKNNNHYYEALGSSGKWRQSDETRFQAALNDAIEIHDSGYPVRFLMRGFQYIRDAALDMKTVAQYVETREAVLDFPVIYMTPRGFWPAMVAAKEAEEAKAKPKSYADLVNEIAPGTYVAPYIDDQVTASPTYWDFDDVYRQAIRLGYREQDATRALRLFVKLAANDAQHYRAIQNSYFLPPTSRDGQPGALFFETAMLPEALDRAEELGLKGKAVTVLEALEAEHQADPNDYDNLVFDD